MAVIVAYNLVYNLLLPGVAYVPVNLAVASVLVWYARCCGLRLAELGLARSQVGGGVKLGLVVLAVAVPLIMVAGFLPGSGEAFVDSRVTDAGLGEMLYQVLIRIPLGTALFEEVAFRGVLLALLLRNRTALSAVLLSSMLFGLWHVIPAMAAIGDNALVEGATQALSGQIAAVIGTVAVTTLASCGFCWLRLRADSLVAPVIAHAGINRVAFATAWLSTR